MQRCKGQGSSNSLFEGNSPMDHGLNAPNLESDQHNVGSSDASIGNGYDVMNSAARQSSPSQAIQNQASYVALLNGDGDAPSGIGQGVLGGQSENDQVKNEPPTVQRDSSGALLNGDSNPVGSETNQHPSATNSSTPPLIGTGTENDGRLSAKRRASEDTSGQLSIGDGSNGARNTFEGAPHVAGNGGTAFEMHQALNGAGQADNFQRNIRPRKSENQEDFAPAGMTWNPHLQTANQPTPFPNSAVFPVHYWPLAAGYPALAVNGGHT
ncbi:hypothetical protein ACOSQ2_023501 [Xanthoceras sorbifolium]